MGEASVAQLAVERINHLEAILASSLFGLIITSTLALVGGAFALRNADEQEAASKVFLTGANLLYGILSSYYYFMLIHFYAAATVAVAAFKQSGVDMRSISDAWGFFKIAGVFGWPAESTRNVIGLSLAPLFPVSISCLTIAGLWGYLRGQMTPKIKVGVLIRSLAFQIGLFFLIAWGPFRSFVAALGRPGP